MTLTQCQFLIIDESFESMPVNFKKILAFDIKSFKSAILTNYLVRYLFLPLSEIFFPESDNRNTGYDWGFTFCWFWCRCIWERNWLKIEKWRLNFDLKWTKHTRIKGATRVDGTTNDKIFWISRQIYVLLYFFNNFSNSWSLMCWKWPRIGKIFFLKLNR